LVVPDLSSVTFEHCISYRWIMNVPGLSNPLSRAIAFVEVVK